MKWSYKKLICKFYSLAEEGSVATHSNIFQLVCNAGITVDDNRLRCSYINLRFKISVILIGQKFLAFAEKFKRSENIHV